MILIVLIIASCWFILRLGGDDKAVNPAPVSTDETSESHEAVEIESTGAPFPIQILTLGEPSKPSLIAIRDINLRSGPGTDYEIVGSLSASQTLEIIGRNHDSTWWQVSAPNGAAWVADKVVTIQNAGDNIPVSEVPPTPTTAP